MQRTDRRGGSRRARLSWLSSLTGSGGAAFFAASIVVNLTSFGFNMVMSRMLGTATYGALGSLIGLVNIASLVVIALQAAVTQAVASRRGPSGTTAAMSEVALFSAMRTTAWVSGSCIAIFLAVSTLLESYLHLGSVVPVVLLGIYLSISIATMVPMGVLMGQMRFGAVGGANVVGAFIRIASGPLFVAIGLGLDGAVMASVAGSLATLVAVTWPLKTSLKKSHEGEKLDLQLGSTILAVLALSGASAFTGIDTFLARHVLSPVDSGFYAAGANAARIAFFMTGAVASLAFPRFARYHGSGPEARRILLHSLVAVGILGALSAAVLGALPHLAISLLFGSRYAPGASIVGILAVSGLWLGLAGVLVYYQLARRSWAAPAAWLGIAVAVIAISTLRASMNSIAWVMFSVTAGVLVVLTIGTSEEPRRSFLKALPTIESRRAAAVLETEGTPELSVVVPYYNPGERLRSTVEGLVQVLDDAHASFEVIAVSDGSTDGSDTELDELVSERVVNLRLPANHGKGQALREGLSVARGSYLGFIDADGDIPPSYVARFLKVIRDESPDIILGSKRHPESTIVYPFLRRVYSWGYQFTVFVLFHLSVRDTQTGLKFIRRETLAEVLPRMLEKRFAFDLELLVVARHLGFDRVVEAPVTIAERFTSTISIKAVCNTLIDTFAIFYRLHFLRYYDEPHSHQEYGALNDPPEFPTPTVVA